MSETLPDSEVIARSDANFVDSFRLLGRAIDGGEVRDSGGITIVATGLPVSMFNVAFVTQPLANPAAQLASAVAHFKAREVPFVVRMCGGGQPEAQVAAVSMGLAEAPAEPGMAMLNSIPLPPESTGLRIVTARDGKTLDDHALVCSLGFGMPLEIASKVVPPALLSVLDAEVYVGYIDGRPVTSSALFLNNGVAGVYNVATVDSHRRMGLGEAMTWHAVRRGRELGCLFSSLQASDMGRPIYERMGYGLATTYPTFTA